MNFRLLQQTESENLKPGFSQIKDLNKFLIALAEAVRMIDILQDFG